MSPSSIGHNLLRNIHLCRELVKRDIAGRFRESVLGYLWLLLVPIAMLLLYTYVFGVVFKLRWPNSGGSDLSTFSLFLFTGLIAHGWLSDAANRAASLIQNNAAYVKKIAFPLSLLPVISVISSGIYFLVSLGVCLVGSCFLGNCHIAWLALPLVLLPFFLILLGLSWLFAAIGVFFRDLGHAMPLIMMFLSYLSPVFYPISAVPEPIASFLYINPMTSIIELFRSIILLGTWPATDSVVQLWLIATLLMTIGLALFSRLRPHYADVI